MPEECKGYENSCFCANCEAEDTYYEMRARKQVQMGETDWSWVTPPRVYDQEREEYYADLADGSGYERSIETAYQLGYIPRHNAFCACSDCLAAKAEGRTSQQMRRTAIPVVNMRDVEGVIAGCEALLASPRAKFVEWCRENGRE